MKNFIFNHIPKCGGTALREYFIDCFSGSINDFIYIDDLKDLRTKEVGQKNSLFGHMDHTLVRHFQINHLLFSMVRNPAVRTLSALRHSMRDPTFYGNTQANGRLSFDDVISDPLFRSVSENNMTKLFCGNKNFLEFLNGTITLEQYHDYYQDDLDLAISNIDEYDYIGVHENYPESIRTISDIIGSKRIKYMPRMNDFQDGVDVTLDHEQILQSLNTKDNILYQYITGKFKKSSIKAYIQTEIQYQNFKYHILDLGSDFQGSGWYSPEIKDQIDLSVNRYNRWAGLMQNISVSKGKNLDFLILETYCDSSATNLDIKFLVNNNLLPVSALKMPFFEYFLLDLSAFKGGELIDIDILCNSNQALDDFDDLRVRSFMLSNAVLCSAGRKEAMCNFLELHPGLSPFWNFFNE